MKNQLEKLGQTESVFTSNIEAGNTVTIQRGLLETETREGVMKLSAGALMMQSCVSDDNVAMKNLNENQTQTLFEETFTGGSKQTGSVQ